MTPDAYVEAPWLCPEQRDLAVTLLRSHQRAFGRPLWTPDRSEDSRHLAQELFAATTVVLAHDGADPTTDPGPRLIYANRAALTLWRRPWQELVGMASQLTAAPAERLDRARALGQVRRQQAIANYSSIRIDSQGRRFQIRRARIWTLWAQAKDHDPTSGSGTHADIPCGQAAAFSDWHWL